LYGFVGKGNGKVENRQNAQKENENRKGSFFRDLFEKLRKIKYNCGKNTSINTKYQGQIRQKVS